MPLANQYRRYAAECVRVAQQTANEKDKLLLLRMAETWTRLAHQAEARDRPTPASGGE